MNILPCINKESTDWKQLVVQTNEQLAKDIYATKGGMPSLVKTEEILDFLKVESLKIDNKKPGIKKEKLKEIGEHLSLFNELNNSSHSIKVEDSGQLQLNMNYLSKESSLQRQTVRDDRTESLSFADKLVIGIHEKVNKDRLSFVKELRDEIETKIKTAEDLTGFKGKFLLRVNSIDDKGNTLRTTRETNSWGKRVKKHFDDLYNSKLFDSIITLEERTYGTILHISPSIKLIDHFESEYRNKTDTDEKSAQEDLEKYLLYSQTELNKKSEEEFVKSDTFVNKKVVPQVTKFMLSKLNKIIYSSNDDILTEFGDKAQNIPVLSKDNNIFINKERVSLDSPIKTYIGHMLASYLKKLNPSIYNEFINLANQTSTKSMISPRLDFLDKESIGIAVFSKLLNENEVSGLNTEESSYLNELNKLINSSVKISDVFSGLSKIELDINLNSSLRDILIQLKDDTEFIVSVNKDLDLSKEEIFSNISNKEFENKLEELNYIQKICKV